MSKIIVYEHVDFKGLRKVFTSSVPKLENEFFNNCISSLRVIGNPWVAYSDFNFSGKHFVFEEGDYAQVESNEDFSSLELLSEDLSNPQITLYEHPNYWGRSVVLTSETNLIYGSFDNMASSHKVQRGVWILYEHINRGGDQMLARASRDVPSYGWPNKTLCNYDYLADVIRVRDADRQIRDILKECSHSLDDLVSHLRPLRAGKPIITAEVLWSKKEERVKSAQIDSVCALNYGDHEQSFSQDIYKEYASSVTDSFKFSDSTQISWGFSFGIDVGIVKSEMNFSLSNTFTVERGSTNTRTEKKSIRVSLPTKVPPHTKLTVNMVRKEVNVKVPVEMTITSGSHSVVEYGEYGCQSGTSISAEYKEERI